MYTPLPSLLMVPDFLSGVPIFNFRIMFGVVANTSGTFRYLRLSISRNNDTFLFDKVFASLHKLFSVSVERGCENHDVLITRFSTMLGFSITVRTVVITVSRYSVSFHFLRSKISVWKISSYMSKSPSLSSWKMSTLNMCSVELDFALWNLQVFFEPSLTFGALSQEMARPKTFCHLSFHRSPRTTPLKSKFKCFFSFPWNLLSLTL